MRKHGIANAANKNWAAMEGHAQDHEDCDGAGFVCPDSRPGFRFVRAILCLAVLVLPVFDFFWRLSFRRFARSSSAQPWCSREKGNCRLSRFGSLSCGTAFANMQ